jgi:hypothetical protein
MVSTEYLVGHCAIAQFMLNNIILTISSLG